jgi:hypothetical protein
MFPESNIYIPNFDSQGTSTIRTSNSYSRLPYKLLVTACHDQAWYHQQRFPEAIFIHILTLGARSTGVCEREGQMIR